jgi:hypothetical protein
MLTAGVSVLGFLLTLVLPEPSGRSLEELASGPAFLPAHETDALLASPPGERSTPAA